MDPMEILWQPFRDHKGEVAFSVTYPVPAELQATFAEEQIRDPGAIETYLGYPSFPVFTAAASSSHPLEDKQKWLRATMVTLISVIERAGFFEKYQGIRFEVFDSPRSRFDLRPGLGCDNHNAQRLAKYDHMERAHRKSVIEESETDVLPDGTRHLQTPHVPLSFADVPFVSYRGYALYLPSTASTGNLRPLNLVRGGVWVLVANKDINLGKKVRYRVAVARYALDSDETITWAGQRIRVAPLAKFFTSALGNINFPVSGSAN